MGRDVQATESPLGRDLPTNTTTMHRINLPTYFAPLNMLPGDYYSDDQIAAVIMSHRRGVTLTHCTPPAPRVRDGDILVSVAGGHGDLLMMTPALRELRKREPEARIVVATMSQHIETLRNNPNIDELVTVPIKAEIVDAASRVYWAEGLMTNAPDRIGKHGVDLFGELLGVEVTERRLDYVVTNDELETAESRFPRVAGKKRVGIQVDASSPNRCYPREQMAEAAEYLVQRGCEVFLFGAPGSVTGGMPGVTNLTQIPSAPDFRESAAILYTCDVVICPDSAFLHLASALNVPCVALFAAFDPATRVTGKQCYVFTGKGDCVGCSFHSCGYDQWPEGKPCSKVGQCIPLAEIPPERIGAKAMQLATNL